MALRIFYTLIALIAAYICFEIYVLYSGYKGITDVPAEYTIGPQDADISVVEFLDYNCRFCKEIHPTITEAVKKDGNVLYIPRPLPSENPESVYAALLAYTAGRQGKFIEMHNALIENYRVINEEVLAEFSQNAGVDIEQLTKDIENESVEQQVLENGRLFKKLKGNATPTFIIGERIFYVPQGQMPTVDDFLAMFNEARGRQ